MHIITGGTGQVGSSLANELLKKGEKVTIISRDSAKAKEWKDRGANFAVADINDTAALHSIFKTGKSIFVLNPPANPSTNTEVEEHKTIASLLAALKDCGAEQLVVESTLGAQKGNNIGDLGLLYKLEQGIKKLSYPYSIIRPAYFMSNWARLVPSIIQTGKLMSFYPAEMKMPMVSPEDIGKLAAGLMTEKATGQTYNLQGPELYSANDVAAAFAKALKKSVEVAVVPPGDWRKTYKSMGFSDEAIKSYTGMTTVSLNDFKVLPDLSGYLKGETPLLQYINNLIAKQAG